MKNLILVLTLFLLATSFFDVKAKQQRESVQIIMQMMVFLIKLKQQLMKYVFMNQRKMIQ